MLVEDSLLEVVNSANGAERSLLAMRSNVAAAQSSFDRSRSSQGTGATCADLELWTDPEVVNAWYEFMNLLTWVRSIQDRVDRKDSIGKQKIGLLHYLDNGPLNDRIKAAYGTFKEGAVKEARWLTNYGIHAGLVPSPRSPLARVNTSGLLTLVMPDRLLGPIDNGREFTFQEDRDALAFADGLFDQVAAFIDLVIDAFRDAVPDRFRNDRRHG